MTDYRRIAYREAAEREARFADAFSMSRTRYVGQSLDEATPQNSALVLVRDSRTCSRCGSRYGHCEHTKGEESHAFIPARAKAFDRTETRQGRKGKRNGTLWSEEEVRALRDMYSDRMDVLDIAAALGRGYSSVMGKLDRMGLSAEGLARKR